MKMPRFVHFLCRALVQTFILSPTEIAMVCHCWASRPSLIANMALNLSKMPLLEHVSGSPSAGQTT